MRDDLPDWLDDPDDETRPASRRRLRLLLVAAVLPWLVIVGLVTGTWDRGRSPDADPATTEPIAPATGPPGAAAPPDAPAPPDAGAPPDADASSPAAPDEWPPHGDPTTDGVTLAEVRGGWRLATEDGDVAALATVVARAWLTGVEPVLPVDGISPPDDATYVEHLVVEAVEHPGPGAAVATLLAVVLDRDGEELAAHVRRLAVPVTIDEDGPRPAGAPWWLPAPDLTAATLPVADDVDEPQEQLAAADALAAAGFHDVVVHGLARSDRWPVVAEVSATTPDGERVDGPVWLRPHVDGLVVVGSAPPAEAPDEAGASERSEDGR